MVSKVSKRENMARREDRSCMHLNDVSVSVELNGRRKLFLVSVYSRHMYCNNGSQNFTYILFRTGVPKPKSEIVCQ